MMATLPDSQITVGPRSAPVPDPAHGARDLAHAFDRAHHDRGCDERRDVASSADDVRALREAVRAFVEAERADGSAPEYVLAMIKRATRPCLFDGADEARGDRLQTLILREFLASYYDVEAPSAPEPTVRE